MRTPNLLIALAMAGTLAGSLSSETFEQVSDEIVFRFGVEADWPDSTRYEIGHLDASVAFEGCGNGFSGGLNLNPGLVGLQSGHFYAGENSRFNLPSIPEDFG
ncbi:MAG: hypothetical protein AAGB34_08815, partial [Planctomycetota bacterium]